MSNVPVDPNVPVFVGELARVPVIVRPPANGTRPDAAVVLAWHLQDAPSTEAAFAAALPLDGLDAWRVYIGLPLSGSRLPPGGRDELMRLGHEDAVMNLQGPVSEQGAAEAVEVFEAVRQQFRLTNGPLGALGGSMGAAIALSLMADGSLPVRAAVLVSPLVQLRSAVDALAAGFGFDYPWSPPSEAVAARLDFVARAAAIVGNGPAATLMIVGEDDDQAGFVEPARRFVDACRAAGGDVAELLTIAGMGHTLADEPGDEPAPQTASAATVDAHAVDWFRRHLTM